ncbi:MAG: hypothetical protein ACOX5J_06830 [Candidatus Hydrogenedentales bacterium]|jgi:hypothetical protein
MGTRTALLVFLPVALVCTGCPVLAPINLSGRWEGPIFGEMNGIELSGTMSGEILHEGSEITGVWSTSFTDTRYNNGGIFSGTVRGRKLTAKFVPSRADTCPFVAVATFTRDTIEGSYSAVDCHLTQTGTVELHRISVKEALSDID